MTLLSTKNIPKNLLKDIKIIKKSVQQSCKMQLMQKNTFFLYTSNEQFEIKM